MSFAKLDSGIVNSTLWVQPHDVLRVWVWFLSQADANGVVRTAAPALAHACMVPLDRMREILALLEAPDPDSRSTVEDGRRIEKIEGGWAIVNYRAYRERVSAEEKREADRRRIAEKRAEARKESEKVVACRDVSHPVAEVAQAEAEEEVEAIEQEQEHVQAAPALTPFLRFWAAYPNKKGKQEAEKTWRKRKLDARCDDLIAHVRLMAATDADWLRGYAPMGSTYLNQARWEDVPKRPYSTGAPGGAQSKTLSAIKRLEAMKHGLAGNRTADGVPEVALLGAGSDPGD